MSVQSRMQDNKPIYTFNDYYHSTTFDGHVKSDHVRNCDSHNWLPTVCHMGRSREACGLGAAVRPGEHIVPFSFAAA
eukprot:6183373-Pleurochrysis_carterae.AAC.2